MSLENSVMKLMQNSTTIRGVGSQRTDDVARRMSRYSGGHQRKIHPYISGYWYALIKVPHAIFSDTKDKEKDQVWLHSTAETFNPPSRTLTKVDVPAMGGLGASFIAGQQLTRTFSMEFREYQDTPVTNIFERWTSVIDSHYGVSHLGPNQYIPHNYKGAAYIMLCKPTIENGVNQTITANDVERFYFFEGVFPEGTPEDIYSSDIATNDVARLNVTFSFDGWPIGKENQDVLNYALKYYNDHYLNFNLHHVYHTTEAAVPVPESVASSINSSISNSGPAAVGGGTPTGTDNIA